MLIRKLCTKLKKWGYSKISLRDGLRAYIGFSSIFAICICVAEFLGFFAASITANEQSPIGILVDIAVVLWTAGVTFLLFSIERLEVVNLGIRLRQVLRVAVSQDRYLLYNALLLLVAEAVLMINAAWNTWNITCFVVTLMMSFNLVYVVFIVLRYNSREMALRCVLQDIHDKITVINHGNVQRKKKDSDERLFGPVWNGIYLYFVFRIGIGLGVVLYKIIEIIIKLLLRLFLEAEWMEFVRNENISSEETALVETEWLIYQMCRNMDYDSREDCIALEEILKEIDKYGFEGKRKLFVRCISTILEESENERHTGEILEGLYREARAEDDGDLDLRKALIESVLLTGKPEHIHLLNALEMKLWEDKKEPEELKIRYWKYICSVAGRKRIALGGPTGQYLYEEPEDVEAKDMLELTAQLAYDEDTLDIEFLQNIF